VAWRRVGGTRILRASATPLLHAPPPAATWESADDRGSSDLHRVGLGGPFLEELALPGIEARLGDRRAAIDRLEHLLSIPMYLTPVTLRLDPSWVPIPGDPRFERLAGNVE
jgi:hypothetical protein